MLGNGRALTNFASGRTNKDTWTTLITKYVGVQSLLEAVAKIFEGQPVQTVLILSKCFPNIDENDWVMSIKNKKCA